MTHAPTNHGAGRLRRAMMVAAVAAPLALPAHAAVEGGFEPGSMQWQSVWYGPATPAARKADLDYVAGMRPHHAGALTMSQEYLADPQAGSPLLKQLACAIIANQTFEVGLLDEVARNLQQPPIALGALRLQPMASEGLGQATRFWHVPMPTALGYAVGPVSERDVRFAKAMTVHHQGALDMARAYHANPQARNGFLGLFNVDVRTDQAAEIALMAYVVRNYPGDADAVKVDPSEIHGMEGMMHGAHGGGHGGHAGHGAPGDVRGRDAVQPSAAGTMPAPNVAAPVQQAAPPTAAPSRPGPQARPQARQPAKAQAGHEGHMHNH